MAGESRWRELAPRSPAQVEIRGAAGRSVAVAGLVALKSQVVATYGRGTHEDEKHSGIPIGELWTFNFRIRRHWSPARPRASAWRSRKNWRGRALRSSSRGAAGTSSTRLSANWVSG